MEHVKLIRANPQANCAPHCNIHHIWERESDFHVQSKLRSVVKIEIGESVGWEIRHGNVFLPVRAPIAFM